TMTLGHTTSQDLSIQAKTRMEHNAVMINDNALGGSNDSAVILRDDGDNNKAIGWRDIQDEVAVWETTDVVGPNDPSGLIDFQKYAEFHCEQLHLEPNITLTENNSLGFNASGELVARDNAGNTVQLTNGGATAGDADAIHDNVAGEIAALTLVTAAAGDHILIEDASDSNNKKRIAASDLLGAGNFGQNYESAVSLANSATTLTGYQVKLTHTTPAHASGTFLVEATWSGSTTVKNKIGFWRFQNTTDAVTYSEEQNLSIANNSYFTMSSRGFVTFSGVAKTFEIQWRSSIGDEVNIRNARFTIWRVS
ncbi:MAG TPA: hypothetical protein VLA24_16725, partial [Pseudomonadales bacterium]|nr:hypothetical protein [Pseudomonadales bacterium]